MTSLSLLRLRASIISVSLAATITITGCSGFESTASNSAAATAAISGSVRGGQQPISGSHIYLYAAGINATYGAASSSLLNTSDRGVLTDSNSLGYVATDINGNFSITSDYTCPDSAAPIYLLAAGGNPGLQPLSTNNTAITLMAVLGPCSSINSSTTVVVNEATTVAAAVTLQQFMADPVHLGASPNNLTGLVNAANSAINIVDRTGGFARATTLLGNGTVPQSKLNSLADTLSPCVNTPGPTSNQCAALFNLATPPGGAAPTDVATAMLFIAQNPANHVNNLFNLADSNAPFQPTLPAPPNDYTIGVTYSGGGLDTPGPIAIDSLGDIYGRSTR
jgi:hypothetical protein